MLTIHHLGKSQSERIIWLCEELALPYTLKLHKRDAVTILSPPELKELHPLGAAPVITDEDEDRLPIAAPRGARHIAVEGSGEESWCPPGRPAGPLPPRARHWPDPPRAPRCAPSGSAHLSSLQCAPPDRRGSASPDWNQLEPFFFRVRSNRPTSSRVGCAMPAAWVNVVRYAA